MAGIRAGLVLVAGVVIGGAVVIAHRVSRETGKSFVEAFADVPTEAQRIVEDVRARAEEAIERGRQAYGQKQAEMEEYLNQGGKPAE